MSQSDKLTPIAILLAAVLLACFITGPKLHKMYQITGQVPGAKTIPKEVTVKWVERAKRLKESDGYYVSWNHNQIRESRDEYARVPEDVWKTIQVGDEIEVVYIAGDSSPYLRNGTFVEPGNFIFDYVLLATEMLTALAMIVWLVWLRHRLTPKLTPEFVREKITAAIQIFDESLARSRQELGELEEQARSEQSPELKSQLMKQVEEKRKAIEETTKSRQSLDDQLKRIQFL